MKKLWKLSSASSFENFPTERAKKNCCWNIYKVTVPTVLSSVPLAVVFIFRPLSFTGGNERTGPKFTVTKNKNLKTLVSKSLPASRLWSAATVSWRDSIHSIVTRTAIMWPAERNLVLIRQYQLSFELRRNKCIGKWYAKLVQVNIISSTDETAVYELIGYRQHMTDSALKAVHR